MSQLIVEVVRINDITKHPNADTLSIATVKGWNCIFKTGDFNTGDLAIYVPIDAVLPDNLVELYKLEYLKGGSRVRSVKLRGVLSQGLLLTIPQGYKFSEGQDVADALKITKWEPPLPSYQQVGTPGKPNQNRPNPNFKRYTDIDNVKNYQNVFKDGDMCVITEKIHGTNFRAGLIPLADTAPTLWGKIKLWWQKFRGHTHEFVVGSHNVQLVGDNPQFYDGNLYWNTARKYDLEAVLPMGYVLFGEIYGAGVQDLTYGMNGVDVAFFDLMIDGQYVEFDKFMEFCKAYNLPTAPVLYRGAYSKELLDKHTNGKSVLCPSQIREGCVVRSIPECNDLHIGRKILKSVSEAYLLRKNGTESH